jgi:hypothetical protein
MSPEMCVTTFVCSVVLIWILDGSQWGKQNWFILGCTIFHLYWPTILDGYLQRISNICVQYKYNLFSECSESFASQLYMRGYTFWVCGEQILKRSSATGDRTQCLVFSHKPMKPKCTWIFIWIIRKFFQHCGDHNWTVSLRLLHLIREKDFFFIDFYLIQMNIHVHFGFIGLWEKTKHCVLSPVAEDLFNICSPHSQKV